MTRLAILILLLVSVNAKAQVLRLPSTKLHVTFLDSLTEQLLDSVRITFTCDDAEAELRESKKLTVNKKLAHLLEKGCSWSMKVEHDRYQARIYPFVSNRKQASYHRLFVRRSKSIVVKMKLKPVVRLVEVTEN